MNELYPLKFTPQILDKIWGGTKLKELLQKPTTSPKAGESWEISCVPGNISVVSNGFLSENSLEELIEVYMGDLIGDRIFDQFGTRFPLLVKFIDANDILSIQVHPNDELAGQRHKSYGKTEMWYVMQANQGAELIVGFNGEVNKEMYLKHLNDGKLPAILNTEKVKEGDVFFLPAGRVHAIGAGILLAEIQQTSDITYRIYDFDRKDNQGNLRELHTKEAVDAIDYTYFENYKTEYNKTANIPSQLVSCKYFTTNFLDLSAPLTKDISSLDCFVIYMCVNGSCTINYNDTDSVNLQKGESVLVPASLINYTLAPDTHVQLLEVFIDPTSETDES